MTTETSPLNRQPSKLDYSSPTQFRFLINQLPKVQYFTTACNIPGISLNEATYNTPLKDIPLISEETIENDFLNWEKLTIRKVRPRAIFDWGSGEEFSSSDWIVKDRKLTTRVVIPSDGPMNQIVKAARAVVGAVI